MARIWPTIHWLWLTFILALTGCYCLCDCYGYLANPVNLTQPALLCDLVALPCILSNATHLIFLPFCSIQLQKLGCSSVRRKAVQHTTLHAVFIFSFFKDQVSCLNKMIDCAVIFLIGIYLGITHRRWLMDKCAHFGAAGTSRLARVTLTLLLFYNFYILWYFLLYLYFYTFYYVWSGTQLKFTQLNSNSTQMYSRM